MVRSDSLQSFLDSAFVAFDQCVKDPRAHPSIMQIFAHLKTQQAQRKTVAKRLPVCVRYLESVLNVKTDRRTLDGMVECFRALEPELEWKPRASHIETASENLLMGHANTMIAGPGGLEDTDDIWLGATLLAPNDRYPDDDHEPEETYIVLSEGEFMQGVSGWFSPGVGSSFYNPPGIRHAMLYGHKPLFAFLALLPDQQKH